MGIREDGDRTRFYCHSHGTGSASYFFLTGAVAVLSSCKLHWWPLSESSYSTMREMSTELLQWHGETSERACTAGPHGMNAVWAAKIDSVQAKRLAAVARRSSGFSNRLSREAEHFGNAPIVPVEDFTLKNRPGRRARLVHTLMKFSTPLWPLPKKWKDSLRCKPPHVKLFLKSSAELVWKPSAQAYLDCLNLSLLHLTREQARLDEFLKCSCEKMQLCALDTGSSNLHRCRETE